MPALCFLQLVSKGLKIERAIVLPPSQSNVQKQTSPRGWLGQLAVSPRAQPVLPQQGPQQGLRLQNPNMHTSTDTGRTRTYSSSDVLTDNFDKNFDILSYRSKRQRVEGGAGYTPRDSSSSQPLIPPDTPRPMNQQKPQHLSREQIEALAVTQGAVKGG